MINRRNLMKLIGVAAIANYLPGQSSFADAQTAPAEAGPFSLPPLPYEYDALEPYIDAQTMHLHHDKHHAAYVKNLNVAVASDSALAKLSVEDLIQRLDKVPESIRTTVRNNAGGHANHSFFWKIMQKNAGGSPKGELARAINKKFGNFGTFQEQFSKAALSVFGSGWAWLTVDGTHQLAIETTPNQDSPWMVGKTPILGIDVWEHAYYLKYQNVRADYVAAFYRVISWDFANERFQSASKA